MKRKLAVRLGLPLLGIILAVASLLGWFIVREQRADLYESANTAVKSGISSVREVLSATDQLSREKVDIAMRTLRSRGAPLGVPSLGGMTKVGAESVPTLALGSTMQTNSFSVVDQATAVAGGTATLFVRRGDDFVRVSTNVKKSDGTRAIGTLLDPKGKAIAAIKSGQPFYGVVDILGAPFMTGYEPMRNSRGEVIGIWYTGYPLSSLDKVKQALADARVLDGGFCAVLDAKGKVLFRSQHVSDEQIAALRGQTVENGWVIQSELFPAWGYAIVAGYPLEDVQARLNRIIAMVTGGFLAMVIGITLALVVLVRRLVAVPLRAVARSMENADLNSVLAADRADEIGQLSRAFDGFVESIRTTLLKVTEASSAVASASSEISSSTEEMAAGAHEQTSQTGEVASAVEEMTKTIVENSRNASHTAETANTARAAAEKGGQVVAETVAGMHRISEVVHGSAAIVRNLGKSSDQIGEIIGVINDIADQTNLLALNAAIEAARAGDQGRGFAVVADEVRRLAERTTKATKEIAVMIRTIQSDTAGAVTSMERGTKEVEQGIALADRAGTSLQEIVGISKELTDMIMQIAAASEEQSKASEDISRNVEGISKVTSETASGTQQIARAAEDLDRLTEQLHELVRGFELHDHQTAHQRNSVSSAKSRDGLYRTRENDAEAAQAYPAMQEGQ